MLKRGKKAEIQHELMMGALDLLLAGALLLALLNYIGDIKSNDGIQKEYLSKDIALTIDALYPSPADIENDYDPGTSSLSGYNFKFDNNKVEVWNPDKKDDIVASYPFATDGNVRSYFQTLEKPGSIIMTKKGNLFQIISTEAKIKPTACPDVDTKDIMLSKTILVDPGHGGNDKGYVGTYYTESYVTFEAAKAVKSSEYDISLTRSGDENMDMAKRLNLVGLYDLILSLHAGIDSNRYNTFVKIYFNSNSPKFQQDQKLACIMYNKFIAAFPHLTGIEMQGINAEQLPMNDPRKILAVGSLDPAPVGVYLEFGNVNQEKGMLDYSAQGGAEGIGKVVNQVIIPGLEEYYG